MNALKTPQSRNVTFLSRPGALLLTAFALAISFTTPAFGQGFTRPDGSVPVPMDWSSRHVAFTGVFTPQQAATMWNEPRAYAEWLLHGNMPAELGPAQGRPRKHARRK